MSRDIEKFLCFSAYAMILGANSIAIETDKYREIWYSLIELQEFDDYFSLSCFSFSFWGEGA